MSFTMKLVARQAAFHLSFLSVLLSQKILLDAAIFPTVNPDSYSNLYWNATRCWCHKDSTQGRRGKSKNKNENWLKFIMSRLKEEIERESKAISLSILWGNQLKMKCWIWDIFVTGLPYSFFCLNFQMTLRNRTSIGKFTPERIL